MDDTEWNKYGVGKYEKVRRLHGPFGFCWRSRT